MNRYLENGNLIVRTDSFDKLNELSEPLLKKRKNKTKLQTWKKVITGNENHTKKDYFEKPEKFLSQNENSNLKHTTQNGLQIYRTLVQYLHAKIQQHRPFTPIAGLRPHDLLYCGAKIYSEQKQCIICPIDRRCFHYDSVREIPLNFSLLSVIEGYEA